MVILLKINKVNYSTLFSKLFIQIESFTLPMYYSPRTEDDMVNSKFNINPEDDDDRNKLINYHVKNKDLADLKKILNKNPLEVLENADKGKFSVKYVIFNRSFIPMKRTLSDFTFRTSLLFEGSKME